jgi:hypothetical protein
MLMHISSRSAFPAIFGMIALVVLVFCGPVPAARAGATAPVVNAFYVKRLPATYLAQEKFFAAFKNTGINAVILELPFTEDGKPDLAAVPNAVFLAHQTGARLLIVLPARNMPGWIRLHEEWEDRAYDLNEDSYRRTGKLDLFNTEAVEALAALSKDLASFSVDGLILGADFFYAPLEGMSRTASKFAQVKLDADIDPSDMYKKLGKGPSGRYIQEYSDLFLKWAGLKRDRLLTVYDAIKAAARKGNSAITVGISIPVDYPLNTPVEMLQRFAVDLDAYRRKDADHFQAVIDYRELQEQRNLNYRQATELASRVARSVYTAVKDGQKVIIVLPMTERLTARSLRFSEIEEINGLVRSIGETGFGYVIKPETELTPAFTGKLFRK